MARRTGEIDAMKQALRRADTSLLLYAVVLFQASAMLLLTLRTEPIDTQALLLAGAMPAVTLLLVKGLPKIWKIDRVVLTLVLFLCSVSIVTLTAIARAAVTPLTQALYIAVGLVGMVVGIVFIRHFRHWNRWKIVFMLLSLGFIALPLAIGETKYGAKNWIEVLPDLVSVQPSEFVKMSLMVVLAACLSERQSRAMKVLSILFGAALCGVLLLERDLGALLLYFLATVILYFLATSNGWLSLAGLGAGAAGAVGAYFMFDLVKERVSIWRDPWADATDSGYQLIQSLIAIGSGGLFGMGLGLGMPRMIPLYHSDFVFAAICEQFGMVFALCLLAVYVLITLRGISIAMSCRSGFHALLAFGIVAILGLQTLLIVGGNIRLIPLSGVTLPFIAAGGSSMVSCLTGVGMLLGISSLNADQDEDDVSRAEWQESEGV
ncbi:MAG: FtsW/RodA/SpoVE family cell cycle protein [Clostridia bacterium]|nr:FtsW/RodA/SpoVE family cell cycle protein [Clostridia bacterium]